MTTYIALLRAVNVGGTGKLPMADLRAICSQAGFSDVRTYIASGNLLLSSDEPAEAVRATLEDRLLAYAGRPVGVLVRTPGEMRAVLEGNPFPEADPRHTLVTFLPQPPPEDALDHVVGQTEERLHLGKREIYVHYGSGMGRSKLRLPAAREGTARNINTVAKLVQMAFGD